MIENKRNCFIDMAKGLAIFLMLWGHCIQYCVAGSNVDFFENPVYMTIYSFHMPLFMLISGYLFFYSFSKRDLKALVVHRTQSLIQPIVLCSIFNYLVTDVLFGVMRGNLKPLFSGAWVQNLSSLWFLWSVLVSSLVTAIVCKKFKNILVQIILLFASVLVVAMFPNRDLNIYMYPYFIIGFYFAKYKDKLPAVWFKLRYLSLLLFPVLMCFYEKKHYIYTTGLLPNADYSAVEMLIIDAYRWLIGLVASIFVLTILHIFYKYVIVKCKKNIISTGLSRIGEKSLQIYAFSVPFLSAYLSMLFSKVFYLLNIENFFVKNMFIYSFIFTFGLAVIYAFGIYFIVKVLERLRITKIIFGK